jgi:GH25 family lysozyme M1 (1,4-beta-N-acetylmuramidase)
MKVVDISAWQENVNWQGLIDAGIEGVIIKLGERDTLDTMFVEHVNHAVEYGLKYGVYYYAHACTHDEAVREADTVAAWLTEYLRGETPELGIWYDAESTRMTTGDVTEVCMAFLNRLTDYGHQYEGIYAAWNWLSKDGAHYIDVDALPDYVPLWSAQYNSHDDLNDEYPGRVRIWQYSDHFSNELPYDADIYYDV